MQNVLYSFQTQPVLSTAWTYNQLARMFFPGNSAFSITTQDGRNPGSNKGKFMRLRLEGIFGKFMKANVVLEWEK
jgi:hypothetical protein